MPQNRRSYEKTRRIALSGLLFAPWEAAMEEQESYEQSQTEEYRRGQNAQEATQL